MNELAVEICRRRHLIEWENGRASVCSDCRDLCVGMTMVRVLGEDCAQNKVRHTCPNCLQYTGGAAATEVATTVIACTCREKATYDHLVEQSWHLRCLTNDQVGVEHSSRSRS